MDAARGDRETAGTGWGARLGVLGLAALLSPCGPLLPGPARALEAIDIFHARPVTETAAARPGPARWTLGAALNSSRRERAVVRVALDLPVGGGWRLGGAPLRGQIDFRLRPGGVREGRLRLMLALPPRREEGK